MRGSVRANGVLAHASVGRTDFQAETRARLGHALPGVAREFGLLIGGELVGKAADHAGGIEPLRGHHDGFEHIGRGNHQQGNRLAFFFRDGDGGGKKLLLVVVENLAGLQN